MTRRRLPRALVVAIAAAILCVPAITALGYTYIRDSQGRVVHLHRGVYEIYNGINATTGMEASADYAINNWGNQLANRDTVAVREVPGLTGTEVWFRDYDLPDAGAAVLWQESWHQSALPLDVVFDASKETSWSQDTKQHKACNVIGNILGVADDDAGTDCMNPGNDSPTVAPAGADFVDDFYGPNVSFDDELYTSRTNLDSSRPYRLSATASGHAIQTITVKLDGNQIATKTITPCDGTCSVGVSPNVGPLSVGTHIISATATNEFGQTNDPTKPNSSFNLTVAPNTVIDSGPNGPTNTATPTFTYHSPTAGTSFQCRIDQASFAACPASGYTPSSALANGSHTFEVRANDSGHLDPTPANRTFTIDTVRPVLSVSGDFTDQTNPLVGAGPLEDATATDGGSGVTKIVLKVDGTEAETLDADDDCPAPCSIDDTFFPELSDLAPGSHSFQMFATDAAGNNSTTRSGSFVLDPTAPQIGVTGPLADSSDGPLASASASASIAATDNVAGDSGIASIEVLVDDETDHTYSQNCAPSCPSSASASYTYTKSAWGPGSHLVAFIATDKAGNQQTTTLDVDEADGDPIAACPSAQADVQAAGQVVTAGAAETQAITPAVSPTTNPATDTTDPESADTLDPTLVPSDDGPQWMESTDTLSVDEISQGPVPSIDVGDQICLVPAQTTSSETAQAGTTAGGDVKVYPNTATYTDTIVRPTVGGEAIIESIRGSTAPDSYSFAVGIPPGDQLVQLANGGAAVVNPALPAPPDQSVPPDPHASKAPQQVTYDLPDASAQLAEHNYAVAYAEQATGKTVDAVVQPPETVDAAGNSTTSSLSVSGGTITVDVPSGAKAVVLKAHSNLHPPDIAKSWYLLRNARNLKSEAGGYACTFAHQALAGNRLLIFFLNGVKQFGPQSFGTFNGNNIKNGRVYKALHWAGYVYQITGQDGCYRRGDVTIVYANSNKHVEPDGSPRDVNFHRAGVAQANVVSRLRGDFAHVHARAGGDIESTYSGPGGAKDLVHGATTNGGLPYLDLGIARVVGDWTMDDLCEVSYSGNGNRLPMPEIFNRAQAKLWGDRRATCRQRPGGNHYRFAGALTARGKDDWQEDGFSPHEAWHSLHHQSHGHIGRELSDIKG